MRATLADEVRLFTRPTYSSMIFGLFPAAWIVDGDGISVAMVYNGLSGIAIVRHM